jgi:hypothetical protein
MFCFCCYCRCCFLFLSNFERKISPYAILSLAHSDYGSQKVEEDEATVTVSSVFNMETGPETPEDFQALVAIFCLLHTPVFGHDANGGKVTSTYFPMTPTEWIDQTLFYDYSLLRTCIYGLTTGLAQLDQRKLIHNKDYESQALACGVATEVMRRAASPYLGPFQRMMGTLAATSSKWPQTVTHLFSRLRLSVSSATI